MPDAHKMKEDLLALQVRFESIGAPLNDRIVVGESQALRFSYANTLLCLSSEVMASFIHLIQACSQKQVQHAAWAARNLLELSVWCGYCASSQSNAEGFYEDSLRDVSGILNRFEQLASLASTPPTDISVDKLRTHLNAVADKAGIDDLADDYRRAHDAAKELGPETEAAFKHLNVILSKFVHPTALVVNTVFDEERTTHLLEMCYGLGHLLTKTSLDVIEKARI